MPIGYDLGKEKEEAKEIAEQSYPTVCISDKDCPYLEDTNVGDKLSLITLYEVIGIRKDEEDFCYTLAIKKVAEDAGMKMSKAMEKFMGPHEEVDENGKEVEEGETETEEEE